MIRYSIAIASVLFSIESKAQEVCVGILDKVGRDFSYETREDAKARNLYDNYCEGSSEKSGKTTTVGLDAVIKAIPAKINVGVGSNEEKLKNFCKTYSESSSQSSSELINKSTVVRESLSAFNQCVELTKSSIAFTPTIGTDFISVGIRRTDASEVEILGVTYDSKLINCSGPAGPDGKQIALDNKTRRKLQNADTFPIVCSRIPIIGTGGAKAYPRTEIVFSMSKGVPLHLPISAEEIVSTKTASEIQAQIDNLKGVVASVGARNPLLECKTELGNKAAGQFPSSRASVPEQFVKQGYVVVGGGCNQDGNLNTFIQSMPDKNAWLCQVGDYPGQRIDGKIQAAVTFCKVSQ